MLYLFDLDCTLIEGFLTFDPCERCGGSGYTWDGKSFSEDAGGKLEDRCASCKGKGTVFGEPKPYGDVKVLPGRRERLAILRAEGHTIAVVTNQGGVAFGHQTEDEVNAKLTAALEALDIQAAGIYVCFAHPQATVEGYREGHERRKPSPSMLLTAMNEYGYAPGETVFVGDLDTDRQAAEAAGVRYIDAEEFFAKAAV